MTHAMLAWYGPEALDEVTRHVVLDPAFEADEDVSYRDRSGGWWRPQRDGSWVFRSDTGWQRARRPQWLEGVAPLPAGTAATTSSEAVGQPSEPQGDIGAVAGLVRCVERVRRSYRLGEVVSTMAELVLSDWMLLTRDGRPWTVGVRSGSWYAYGRHGWESADGPPEGPFESGVEAEAIVRDVASWAQLWAVHGPHLPESVTSEWIVPDPPTSFVSPPAPPIDEQAPP